MGYMPYNGSPYDGSPSSSSARTPMSAASPVSEHATPEEVILRWSFQFVMVLTLLNVQRLKVAQQMAQQAMADIAAVMGGDGSVPPADGRAVPDIMSAINTGGGDPQVKREHPDSGNPVNMLNYLSNLTTAQQYELGAQLHGNVPQFLQQSGDDGMDSNPFSLSNTLDLAGQSGMNLGREAFGQMYGQSQAFDDLEGLLDAPLADLDGSGLSGGNGGFDSSHVEKSLTSMTMETATQEMSGAGGFVPNGKPSPRNHKDLSLNLSDPLLNQVCAETCVASSECHPFVPQQVVDTHDWKLSPNSDLLFSPTGGVPMSPATLTRYAQ